jgi:hypothetical protein
VGCHDLDLPPIPDPARPGAITGRAVSALAGRQTLIGVPKARVELMGTGLAVLTDANGYFRLEGIRTSSSKVLFSVDLDGDGQADRQKLLALDALRAGPGRSVAVGEVELMENAVIHGRVRLEGASGQQGHAGTLVVVPQGPYTTTTSDDGSFALADLPAGALSLAFFKAGYEAQALEGLSLQGGQDLSLRPVQLVAQTSVPPAVSLSGSVLLVDGGVASGAVVTVRAGGLAEETSVDGEGGYALRGLPAGLYEAIFTRPGAETVSVTNLFLLQGNTDLAVVVLSPPVAPEDGGVAVPPPPRDGGPVGASAAPLVRVVPFGSGAQQASCAGAGYLLETGLDGNGNGVLDALEVTSSHAVCQAPSVSLSFATAAQCPGGGVVLTSWVDANLDGVFQPSEVVGAPAVACGTVLTVELDAGVPPDAGSNPLGITWGGLPGAWTFGYAVYDTQGLYTMVPFDQVTDAGTLLMLQRADYVSSGDPSVFKNLQSVTWAGVPPGGIALHPGPLPYADDAIIRFTAPRAGPHRFVGAYAAGDLGATLDRIHTSAGFQDHSDPNFAFDFTVSLDAGETVDWMVGNAGPFVGDTTPLEMTSVTLPP